jgi:hypothetical protein
MASVMAVAHAYSMSRGVRTLTQTALHALIFTSGQTAEIRGTQGLRMRRGWHICAKFVAAEAGRMQKQGFVGLVVRFRR